MTHERTLRIAGAQYALEPTPSVKAWQERARGWVADGAASGAELLVFPEYGSFELAATFGDKAASDLQMSLTHVADCAQLRSDTFSALAREFNVYILAPSGPQRVDGCAFVNAAQLMTPHGQIGTQEKLMMTPFETGWGISPGQTIKVFQTELANIGIAICYDVEFPLIVRAMAEAGAEAVLVPSCTEKVSGHNRVKTAAMARALENSIVTVQSPTVGNSEWSPAVDINCGAAGIYVPAEHGVSDTGIVASGPLNACQWVTGRVDLTRLRALRETGEMRNFTDWLAQPGAAPGSAAATVVDLRANAQPVPAQSREAPVPA